MAEPGYQHLVEENRQLREENQRLREENQQLRRRCEQLEAQVAKLADQLEKSQRSNKRQAAPFSKGKPKPKPKRPGRKKGRQHGRHNHRPPPSPDQIDEVHEAELPSKCLDCGGKLKETAVHQQYQVEIPRRPIHRQFNVHVGCCDDCGCRVQGRHPLQTSDALGAAASQVGPDAAAGIVELNKGAGLSHGKVAGTLQSLFGIRVCRGTVARIILRASERVKPTYQAIVKSTSASLWNVADETGWRIGGVSAWLHVFVCEQATCYVIARSRGFDVIEGVLGAEYAGALIHDGWAPYDRLENANHQQCLAHLLRRCTQMMEASVRGAVRFPRQVKNLLLDALNLRDRHRERPVSEHGLAVARGRLENRLDRLLRWPRSNPDNQRLAVHLDKHRDDLFTFLELRCIDATNFRAEQAIRPAVVNRKVWGGNRTDAGAQAQSILMSVMATCRQQGLDSLSVISQAFRGQPPPLVLLPAES